MDCGGIDCIFCIIFYVDNDDDIYGDVNIFILVVIVLVGYVMDNIDCDDLDVNEYFG